MLSKCANPGCSRQFLRLHEGRIFQLSPTPEVEEIGRFAPSLYERFWLCDECCKQLTLIWAGTEARVAPLPDRKISKSSSPPITKESETKIDDCCTTLSAK